MNCPTLVETSSNSVISQKDCISMSLYKFYDMQNESDFQITDWDGVVQLASFLWEEDDEDESNDEIYDEILNPNTTPERIIELLNSCDYDAVKVDDIQKHA